MALAQSTPDINLNQILKNIHSSPLYTLLPNEVSDLVSSFSPAVDATTRPRAYIVLSAFCQSVKKGAKEPSESFRSIADTFAPTVVDYLGETNEPALLKGLSFLIALFQVDPQPASLIFSREGVIENLIDTTQLSPSDTLNQEVAHLLGQACGQKTCRGIITPQIVRWLEFKSRQRNDPGLQAAALVALIKLARGAASDEPENGTPSITLEEPQEQAKMMTDIVLSGTKQPQLDAIEGLAYLSMDPAVKEMLSKNPNFLKKLFALVPNKKGASALSYDDSTPMAVYGIVVIIRNITVYRQQLSEEQKQIEKLKKLAKPSQGTSKGANDASPLDDDEHVRGRISRLVDASVLSVFPAAISASDSVGVREAVGKSLLSIVEEKNYRGKVLQSGGGKVLQVIIKQSIGDGSSKASQKKAVPDVPSLDAIQALAKLSITAAPVQVFGPDVGVLYDAIRPFSVLLQHPSSTLLQRFEAIMALTNLASHSPDLASRISKVDGLVNKVELMVLEEHVLVRRASVELICNLIAGSDDIFDRYGGEDTPNSRSKLHVLLALSDVDDLPTQLAASGALATVTASPIAAQAVWALQFEMNRFFPIMAQLIDPSVVGGQTEDGQLLSSDPGLTHRAIVCLSNVLGSMDDEKNKRNLVEAAKSSRLIDALEQLLSGKGLVKDARILQQAADILKKMASV